MRRKTVLTGSLCAAHVLEVESGHELVPQGVLELDVESVVLAARPVPLAHGRLNVELFPAPPLGRQRPGHDELLLLCTGDTQAKP